MPEQISFVKLVMQYFAFGQHGRKVEISEFKSLTQKDKEELRDLFIEAGYDVAELPSSVVA
jgi:hypothetical protein